MYGSRFASIGDGSHKGATTRHGPQASQLTGHPQAVCLRDLKLLLRAREVARSLLTSQVSEPEAGEMLHGLGVAIDMARCLLISQKGRKRYLREMLRDAAHAPPAGKARVFFDTESVELEGRTGRSVVDQILALEEAHGKRAVSVLLGGRTLLL